MENISFVGTLGRDAEQVVATSGNKRTRLRIAITEAPGTDNEKTKWVDVTAFGTLGENAAASLKKGARVFVMARMDTYQREVTIDNEVKNIDQMGFVAYALGPDLRWATAEVTKNPKGSNGNSSQGAPASKGAGKPAPSPAPADDSEDF